MKRFTDIEKKAAETENQYTLTLAIAKRIRHLRSGAPTLSGIRNPGENAVDAALQEFADSSITYTSETSDQAERVSATTDEQ